MVDVEKVEFIEKFQKRTKNFSLRAIQIFKKLPKNEESKIIGKQFLRSALSVGADEVVFGLKFCLNQRLLCQRA